VLALATINLTTKFYRPNSTYLPKSLICTHFEDMKGDTNVEMGWFGVVEITQGH